jgi:hypothetical protein
MENKWSVGFDYVDLVPTAFGNRVQRFSIIAENSQGFRKTWGGTFPSPEIAERSYLVSAPSVAIWDDITPCYGSEAYAENWMEYENLLD